MTIRSASAPDPFPYPEYSALLPTIPSVDTNRGSYTQVSSVIAAPSTTKAIILGGQSNMADSLGTTAYTVTNPTKVHMMNPLDGAFYELKDKVLGATDSGPASGELSNIAGPLGDDLINRGKATRVITCSIAVGGSLYAEWLPSAARLYLRLTTAILRFRARGAEPDFILWGEGETDGSQGTSAATITTQITAIVDAIRASPISCNAPFYFGQYTMFGGVTNAAVRTGIANAVSVPKIIRLGYDADTNATVAGGYRNPGDTHFSDTGRNLVGPGWGSLILP